MSKNKTSIKQQKNHAIINILQKLAVGLFIGSAAFLVFMLIFKDTILVTISPKIMGTLFITALAVVISVDNLKKLDSRQTSVRYLAGAGFLFNVFWMALCLFLIWNELQFTDNAHYGISPIGITSIALLALSTICILISNILALKYDKTNKRKKKSKK